MTGDDERLARELEALESEAPAGYPSQTLARKPVGWRAKTAGALVVAVCAAAAITMPVFFDTLGNRRTPAANGSVLPTHAASPAPADWRWARIDLAAGRARINDVLVTADGVVAVGSLDAEPMAWYSEDGANWHAATVELGEVPVVNGERAAPIRFAQVFRERDRLEALALPAYAPPQGFVSNDGGRTWERDPAFTWSEDPNLWSGGGAAISDVVETPDGWLAAGHHAAPGWAMYIRFDYVWTSADGRSWSPIDDQSSLAQAIHDGADVNALSATPQRVFAAGSVIWRSDDGATWEELGPPYRGELSTLVALLDLNGTVAAAELVGTEVGDGLNPETTRAQVWWSLDGATWETELSLDAPSRVDELAATSFGVLAVGRSEGIARVWRRGNDGAWSILGTLETERSWADHVVVVDGIVVVIGNLPWVSGDGTEEPDRAVVWIGGPAGPEVIPAPGLPLPSVSQEQR